MGKKHKANRAILVKDIAPQQPRQSQQSASDTKPAQKISWMALAASATNPKKAARVDFAMPQLMPGVVPDDAPAMAMDYGISGGFEYANSTGLLAGGMAWPGFAVLGELSQIAEYRKIAETTARELTRKWISFVGVGDEDKTDKIKAVDAAFTKFGVQDIFRKVSELDSFYGRAQVFIDTGFPTSSDEVQTQLILSSKKIAKGGLKRLTIVEPIYSYPSQYNSSDPLAPHFYDPQEWYVMGRKVHKSRLLSFVSRELPTYLRPAYAFSGLSLSQMARPYIEHFLRARDSVSDLIHSFSVSGIKTNMQATMGGVGGEEMILRAQLFNQMRDNRGLFMLDKTDEEFFNISTPLGTLDHLLAQSQEQISSVCSLPLLILLGISPAGLNASSDGEVRVFYDNIHAQQEHLFAKHLDTIFKIIQLSEFGEIDPDLTYRFNPLWQPNEAEQAVIRKTDVDSAVELINAGVLHPEEERQRQANSEGSLYPGLDVSDVPDPPEDPSEPSLLSDPAKGEAGESED